MKHTSEHLNKPDICGFRLDSLFKCTWAAAQHVPGVPPGPAALCTLPARARPQLRRLLLGRSAAECHEGVATLPAKPLASLGGDRGLSGRMPRLKGIGSKAVEVRTPCL